MNALWLAAYNLIALPLLYVSLRLIALFNNKAKRGLAGRRNLFNELSKAVGRLDNSPRIWIHSSSLGEFEQAKPLIEELRKFCTAKIIVTFFSPSGYENAKKYPHADIISYIPLDTPSGARNFLQLVNPDVSIFMRYDLWPNHIAELARRKKKVFLIDATLRESSPRLIPFIRNFHHHLFSSFSAILTVAPSDRDNFLRFRLGKVLISVVGDTRFDRVLHNSLAAKQRKLLNESIIAGKQVLVAGSTWEEDEEILLPGILKALKYRKDLIVILVPHEPNLPHLERVEQEFESEKVQTIRFSHLNGYSGERVIIVDSIGILLTLYYYADVAFVGGSFKSNVHNVLEAAIYGIPVLYGPKIAGSAEARVLALLGGGIICQGKRDFYKYLSQLLTNDEMRRQKGQISKDYTIQNQGATGHIMHILAPHLNSTNPE